MKNNLLKIALVAMMIVVISFSGCTEQTDTGDTESTSTQQTTTGLTYPIVDTGQITCYGNDSKIAYPEEGGAFYGQDAQYSGNHPSYSVSSDGLTVYDEVTELTWQRSPDTNGDGEILAGDKLSFSEAQEYVDKLNAENYGGYSDWRLPTIKEQYSLILFSGTDPSEGITTSDLIPFIDTDYFSFAYGDTDAGERIIDSQYASETLYVYEDSLIFGVNFADGRIKGYGWTMPGPSEDILSEGMPEQDGQMPPMGEMPEDGVQMAPIDGMPEEVVTPVSDSSDDNDKTFFVICVRGNPDYGINDFLDNGDGTITDEATGLTWSQADSSSGMNWEEALAWVQTMNEGNYLGYDDWRLPNVKELQSIVDYSRSPDISDSAAIDPIFECTAITNEVGETDYPYFWSGTTHASSNGNGSAASYVSFGRSMGYYEDEWQDVHGAGAQKSDPKAGDASDYPEGSGPQGDAVRIDNYVRLVRS
jgi:hypothetical protein